MAVGVVGLVVFLLLNHQVNFNADIEQDHSRKEVEQNTSRTAQQLGFSIDSLATIYQHIDYEDNIEKKNGDWPPTLGGWNAVIGSSVEDIGSFSGSHEQVYDRYGYLQVTYARWGQVVALQSKEDKPNPTFVAHDSLLAAVRKVVNDIFTYDLGGYKLQSVHAPEEAPDSLRQDSSRAIDVNRDDRAEGTVFVWRSKSSSANTRTPQKLTLEVEPEFRHASDSLSSFEYGIGIRRFEAAFPNEKEPGTVTDASNLSILLTYASIAILIVLIFVVGFRQILQGQVDWRRASIIMTASGIIIFLGRSVYLMDVYGTFLSGSAEAVVLAGQLVSSVVMGLFAAIAYIGWEALARKQDQAQVNLVDAFWKKRLFFRETGEAIIRGFSNAFILAGGFVLLLYVGDFFYYQTPTVLTGTVISSSYPWLTLILASLVNILLVSLAYFGVIFSYLKSLFNSVYVQYLSGIIVVGFLMLEPGLMFATNAGYAIEYLVFLALASYLIFVFRQYGIVTLSICWTVFLSLVVTAAFWESNSAILMRTGWGHVVLMGLIFLFGAAAYRYGNSVKELDGYIPEYEERIAHQMRVEKEIEIARESQFKLMPVKAPEIEGIDIYGFFMPSFEVGGDYFDYVVCNSENENDGDKAIAFTIADVSGKAMKAAMQAVFTSGLLLSRLHEDTPATILREICPTIYGRTDPKTFITCLVGRYEINSRKLCLSNAGHCRPILKRNGTAAFIHTDDPRLPLGVRRSVSYKEKSLTLQPGDFLLLYSDGMPEAMDKEGNRLGYDELLSLIEQIDSDVMKASEIAQELKHRIQKFSDHQLADDTTLICLKT